MRLPTGTKRPEPDLRMPRRLNMPLSFLKRTNRLASGCLLIAALLALAMLSYGLLVLSPQRADLPTSDIFAIPTAATAESGAGNPSMPGEKPA